MKGEMYMLIDKAEMLRICNCYLSLMLREEERPLVEAVDFKTKKMGRAKSEWFEIHIKQTPFIVEEKSGNSDNRVEG